MALAVTGCGGDDESSGGGGGDAGGSAQEGGGLPEKTIGILSLLDENEIVRMGSDAAVQATEALGWRAIRIDGQGDPAKIAAGMTTLVNEKVDAIVLVVVEPSFIQAGLRKAEAAGIPVVATFAAVAPSPLFDATYWADPETENQALIERMSEDLPAGSKIGMIRLPQIYNANVAQTLFEKSAKEQGWDIVARYDADLQDLVADTKKGAGDMIRANPEIEAIWGSGDYAVAGVMPAIAGTDVTLYSLHGVPSSISFVKQGKAVVEVAELQRSGFVALDVLARHLVDGDPIPKETPPEFEYDMTFIDETTTEFPFPSEPMLEEFKQRWAERVGE